MNRDSNMTFVSRYSHLNFVFSLHSYPIKKVLLKMVTRKLSLQFENKFPKWQKFHITYETNIERQEKCTALITSYHDALL
jgi:hypothetical protein